MPIRLLTPTAVATVAALCVATPSLARTQPALQIDNLSRTLWVTADASGVPTDSDMRDFTDPGPYMDMIDVFVVGEEGSNASGDAEQDTLTEAYGFKGTGSVVAGGFGTMDDSAYGFARAEAFIDFTTPEITAFYLRYRLKASSNSNSSSAYARVNFFGRKHGGNFFLEIEQSDKDNNYEEVEGAVYGVLGAGLGHSISMTAYAIASAYEGASIVTTADFEFEFTVLDSDRDALLDLWETDEGIDVDGDGEVDLMLMGADPMKKDIFVEYDVAAGVTIPDDGSTSDDHPDPLQMVVDAFALAPAIAVDNPDNSVGVNLHLIEGGHEPTGGVWADPPSTFVIEKATNFGLPSERSSPLVQELLEARNLTHRYCIFANDSSLAATGLGEVPGNDFIVFQGQIDAGYADPDLRIDATAGTFMHELGHALGLRHGGGDSVPFKPNYMSVMNYSFQVPLADPSRPPIWWLDYSREQFDSLDESELVEIDGMGATDPVYNNRMTYWNSAPWSDVSPPLPKLAHGPASGPIDWNKSGSPLDPGLKRHDLNHLVPTPAPTTDLEIFESQPSFDIYPDGGDSLEGFCDWCSLYYRNFGHPNFNGGVFASTTSRDITSDSFEPPLASLQALVFYQRAAACPGDRNADGRVAGEDLAAVLSAWMTDNPDLDFNGDGIVQGEDLAFILAAWGACP